MSIGLYRAPSTRVGGVLFASLLASGIFSCRGCDNVVLNDTTCHPGAPAHGDPNGAPEICKNGLDDNCNGQVDEGCDCNDGDTTTCGSDVGECRITTVTCVNGHFPGCRPNRWPGEVPDDDCNGKDDDCNGLVDDGYVPVDCWTGPATAVLATDGGTSPCHKGKIFCENAKLTDCRGEQLPVPESCNRIDDDCNGLVDDHPVDIGNPCGPSSVLGECRRGTNVCLDGEITCQGAVYPQPEVCDGKDNNCNGVTDEDQDGHQLIQLCRTDCGIGYAICRYGAFVDCSARQPSPEICDGIDNDCNGRIDDGLTCSCRLGDAKFCKQPPLVCGRGVQECKYPSTCDAGSNCEPDWGPCEPFDTTAEVCDNWDNDCDGVVDGYSEACGSQDNPGDVGVCHLGRRTCTAGIMSDCEGEVAPSTERCNGLDDNCNGQVDEGLNPHQKVDMMWFIDNSGSMLDVIHGIVRAAARYSGDFANTEHRFGVAMFPGDMNSTIPWLVITDLTDINTFQAALAVFDANGGGLEPSYDVLYDVSSPADPMQISWRSDAYPYVIMIGDEEAQSLRYAPTDMAAYKNRIAPQFSSCALPGCHSGDKIEIYMLLTKSAYEYEYDTIVYNELDKRIFEIRPADVDRYYGIFQMIFADVCYPAPQGGLDGGPAPASDAGPPPAGGLDGGAPPGHG